MHRYFVSFAHASGFGCSEISLAEPIRTIADIQVVSDLLKPQAMGTPIVLYFAEFAAAHATTSSGTTSVRTE